MWTKDAIRELLAKNDKAVAKAVVAIYERQTADEQRAEQTKYHNGVGFNGTDSRRGSYYATYAKRSGRLTGKHLDIARRMMMKYAGQLADIANENEQAKAVESVVEKAEPHGDIGNMAEEQMVLEEMRLTKMMQAREQKEEEARMRYKFRRDSIS